MPAACAVSPPSARYGEVDHDLSRARLEEQLVLDRRRVHDELGASVRGGHSPEREKTSTVAPRDSSSAIHAVAAPPAPTTAALAGRRSPRAAVSVLEPSTRPSRITSVFTDSTSPSTSSQSATTACLCGVVTFAPAKPSATRPRHRLLEQLGRYAERHVRVVERAGGERGVLHPGRERVHRRVAKQPDELGRAADHPQPKPYSQALA